jgi:alkanesulfonate monooxygenase SsuD/methylene tetrahydromethanopterin reductase-like flavin-dependent oxidoreductase (luciferase family)
MLGSVVSARAPLADVLDQAALLEALGYDSVWVPEAAGRDAIVLCAAIGQRTERITVASGVASLALRDPILLGMQAATAAEACGGRFVLGVGVGHPETAAGGRTVRTPPTAPELAAAVSAVRVMLDRSAPRADRLHGVHLAARPPIVLAALSKELAAVAGECADGMILNWVTPERAAALTATARAAAGRAGRDPAALAVAAYVPVCVTEQADVARFQLARQVVAYGGLRAYRRSFENCGFRPGTDFGRDPAAVSADMLDRLAGIGTAARAHAVLADFRAAGVDLPVLAPVLTGAVDGWASLVGTWQALAPTEVPDA